MLFVLVSFCCVILAISGISNGAAIEGNNFKPSIAELTVPFRENPKILLRNFPGQAVVLPLLNGEPSASNYMVHLARQAGSSDPGHFYVEAPKDYGVMAVIQQLYLRRISDSKSLLQLVNNCKDYLIFEGHNGEKTIPICGTLAKRDDSFYPQGLHGPKFFNSPNGRIKVTFRNYYDYGNELVAQNDSYLHDNQEMLTAQVSFTAYSKCSPTPQEESTRKFRCTEDMCIDSSLACDEVVNCVPGENQRHVGVDEKNCSVPLPPIFTPKSFIPGHKMIHNHHHHHNPPPPRTSYSSDEEVLIDDNEEENSSAVPPSKPPHMTTIIILVILLTFITICGYFWSWLSHVFCVMRSMFRSAEVGIQSENSNSPLPPSSSPPSFTPGSNNNNGNSNTRLPVAYYVPAVVLRTSLNPPLESGRGERNGKADLDCNSPPPSYEILFPKTKE